MELLTKAEACTFRAQICLGRLLLFSIGLFWASGSVTGDLSESVRQPSAGALLETANVQPISDAALQLPDSSNPRNPRSVQSEGKPKDVMTELLHWGLQHSDPEKLKDMMDKYRDNNLTLKDVYGQEVLDALFVDESGIMKESILQISDHQNSSLADDDLEKPILHIQELVEQVDNAGNLHRMGGLEPLLEIAVGSRGLPLKAVALWTLGIAVQNNEPVQNDLLSIDGLPRLATQLPNCSASSATVSSIEHENLCKKLLFALSGLIRNNETTQAAAAVHGVFDWLLQKGIGHHSVGIAKKSMATLETVLAQNQEPALLDDAQQHHESLAKTLLGTLGDNGNGKLDFDLAEKGLLLLNRLLSVQPMLFSASAPSVKSNLAEAVRRATRLCEGNSRDGEFCRELATLGERAHSVLAANIISDEEL
mmetsp:Transcript_124844/g.243004  ORF Transcript_124844/g.243004 Transcript_124844/m.243004 type:complete len:423 (-) Transcript_124844:32-1300(-)